MQTKTKWSLFLLLAVLAGGIFYSCKKSGAADAKQDYEQSRIQSIKVMGFDVSDIQKVDGGYLVEGDIMMTDEFIDKNGGKKLELCITTPLVSVPVRPRLITISAAAGTPASVVTAIGAAVARYNALNFGLRFQQLATGSAANIVVTPVVNQPFIAAAGFPTAAGNPFNSIRFNTAFAGWNANTLATIITHEVGHCIGMRHTDWFNRALSGCPPGSEPAPVACNGCNNADIPNSYMSACIGNGTNRPFTPCDSGGLLSIYP